MHGILRPSLCIVVALLLLPAFAAGVQGNGASENPAISADGRYVAFHSSATNLVAGDTNNFPDIFVRDRTAGTTSRISKSTAGTEANSTSYSAVFSADGRYVAYYSIADNLVAGDTNNAADIFVRDRTAGTTTLVSKTTAGAQGNSDSYGPSLSADGRYVAFHSFATNLVPGDTGGNWDVFVRDRTTGVTTRVSKSTAGTEGNDASSDPSISADGRYVVFESFADNLVSGDSNAKQDVFVRDRQTGITTLVSKSSAGTEGNDASSLPSISGDGRYVAFESTATNLVAVDTGGMSNIYVRDRQAGTTTLISKSPAGVPGDASSQIAAISADGRYVAFHSSATNLVPGDTGGNWDVFVRDRTTGVTTRVSKSTAGAEGNGVSSYPALSADGRYVAFESLATNLVAGDTNSEWDVFVRDRTTGSTTLVSKS